MQVAEEFGTSEDPGKRFLFIRDPKDPAYIWVRRIPLHVQEAIEKKWRGKRKTGRRNNYQPYYDQSALDRRMQLYEKAAYAIKKIENYGFRLVTESAVAKYNEASGTTDGRMGEVLPLDGKPKDEVLFMLFDRVPRTLGWVIDRVASMDELEEEIDEDDEENLDSGSTGNTERGQTESAKSQTPSVEPA